MLMYRHMMDIKMENGDNFIVLTCIYDSTGKSPADHVCFMCQAPLCSFCGYRDELQKPYCNECFKEVNREFN